MYTCGITAYYTAHIGNMRTYINEDILKRVLLHRGYRVNHVQNITDVGHLASDAGEGDDKLRHEAEKEKKSMKEIADMYTAIFTDDLNRLNVIMPNTMPKATDHIPEMLDLIAKLDRKGYLYKAENGIYFDTSKFAGYGELTGMSFERLVSELREGARVEKVAGKRNPTDFAVWRFASGSEKECIWDSPFGRGFPGWHIECSAMSMKYLGKHFDIHCGGIDHIQIHHTNEIAQSEAATGEKFVNYWVHNNFLVVDDKKMSKSLRSIYSVDHVMKMGYSAIALRFFLLSGHYRQTLNFTFEAMSNAEKTMRGIYQFLERLASAPRAEKSADSRAFMAKIRVSVRMFFKSLDDDLNMPAALAAMHGVIKDTNIRIAEGKLSRTEAACVIDGMMEMDEVLGLEFAKQIKKGEPKSASEIEALINDRDAARRAKDFAKADRIRTMLKQKFHVVVEDTESGSRWHEEQSQ
jgi:cysteinyl-tRNA synthetase